MEFKIEKSVFLNGVNRMQAIVADTKSYTPILSSVLIRTNKKGLTMIATDLEITLTENYIADVDSKGEVLLPAKKLQDIIRVMPEGPIHFTRDDNNLVVITCPAKKPTFKLAGSPTDDFPVIQTDDKIKFFEEDKKTVEKLLSKTVWSVSTVEETKSAMTSLLFEAKETNLRMVSSNGSCLTIATLPGKNVKFDKDVLIPLKGAKALTDFVKNGKPNMSLGLGERTLVVSDDSAILKINLVDEEYPNYEKVMLSREKEVEFKVNKADMLQVLGRANVMSDEHYHKMDVSITKKSMLIYSSNEGFGGDVNDDIVTDYKGKDCKFSLNVKIMIDAINLVEGDNVVFQVNPESSRSPVTVAEEKAGGYECLVMPLAY
jgi:DNA polymerase-3 subunit beta